MCGLTLVDLQLQTPEETGTANKGKVSRQCVKYIRTFSPRLPSSELLTGAAGTAKYLNEWKIIVWYWKKIRRTLFTGCNQPRS